MALTARQGREHVGTLLADFAPLATVYVAPVEHMNVPNVVLAPGRPYRTPTAYCADTLNLNAVLTVSRSSGAGGLDALDDLTDALMSRLRGAPRVTVGDVTNVGLTQYSGGAEHLTAIVALNVELT